MNDGEDEGKDGQPPAVAWEAPGGPIRAAGGLLGVVGGEVQGLAAQGWVNRDRGPVAEAAVEVARGYMERAGGVPIEVAERHEGTTAPAWLLAVAVTRPHRRDLVADTLELATAAGVPFHSLRACVAYVELAAALFAGQTVECAVRSVVGTPASRCDADRAEPPLCGESTIDALGAGVWALTQTRELPEVMSILSSLSTPGVGAAVAGLMGLRDGCGALPPVWHRPAQWADECFALAAGLVRGRAHRSVHTVAATAGSVRACDAGHGASVGVGVDVGTVVAAHAITQELEAIEERIPGEATEGVGVRTARGAAARPLARGRRCTCGQRQLEGAGLR